ncbi:unnamed protein product [Parnassius mnemosyne]
MAVLLFGMIGVATHVVGWIFVMPKYWPTLMYCRNQCFALSFLLACVQILDFLSFHHLFGPWAIIIGDLMKDLGRFLAVLAIFVFGFSMHIVALNQPFRNLNKPEDNKYARQARRKVFSDVTMNPLFSFELLFFAVFGQTTTEQTRVHRNDTNTQPAWTNYLFKIVFGIYMLVSVVVLINLLIAMMSDTYQRIQAQSDIEWKYGLSKLIRNMHRTNTAPSPLNLVTTWLMWLIHRCKNRLSKKKRTSLVHMIGTQRQDQLSARSKAGAKWLSKVKRGQVVPKDSTRLSVVHLSPLGSQLSISNTTRIENVVDWEIIAKKYRTLMRDEPEEPITKESEADTADEESEIVPNNIAAAPP